MTAAEAAELLLGRDEDAEWEDDEVREVFAALYGRAPDDDEDADALSLCYAALPPAVESADPNGYNVWRGADEQAVLLGSVPTLDEARRLADRLGGDQIQRGLDGEVEGVQR